MQRSQYVKIDYPYSIQYTVYCQIYWDIWVHSPPLPAGSTPLVAIYNIHVTGLVMLALQNVRKTNNLLAFLSSLSSLYAFLLSLLPSYVLSPFLKLFFPFLLYPLSRLIFSSLLSSLLSFCLFPIHPFFLSSPVLLSSSHLSSSSSFPLPSLFFPTSFSLLFLSPPPPFLLPSTLVLPFHFSFFFIFLPLSFYFPPPFFLLPLFIYLALFLPL